MRRLAASSHQNRLTSATNNGASAPAVTSDADGNTLTDSAGRVMIWDSQNRMVKNRRRFQVKSRRRTR